MPSYLHIRVGSGALIIEVADALSPAPPPGPLPSSFADMTMSVGGARMLIPLYGGSPTHYLVLTGGLWSNPAVWSTGTVPTSSSDVQIQAGADVTVTGTSAVARDIVVQGNLHVCCGPADGGVCINTRLTVRNISVLDGGMFAIGEVDDPVDDGITAELVFADSAIDTAFDPEQWGHGLLVTGESDASMPGMMMGDSGMIRMCGQSRLPTWVRLGAEAHASDTTLTLGTSVAGAWRVGDTLDIPDSRQWADSEHTAGWPNSPQWEQRTIAAISTDGLTITLNSALTYDHLGGRKWDGTWDAQPLYPHVANTTRNVIVRSANPAGTRGHGLFTMRADVDVRHAEFRDLGRTLNAVLDSTTFPGGNPTATPSHIGTNQIGRYPLHWHHCWGPVGGQSNGLPVGSPRLNQGTVYGCSVTNPSQRITGGMSSADAISKWGVTLHDSSWLYSGFNVVADFAGSLITEEQGSETENIVEYNYMTRCFGTGARDDMGRDGDCYWARGASNRVRRNVANNFGPNDYSYGFISFMLQIGNIHIPLVRGADLSMAADGVNSAVIQGNSRGFLESADNEAYAGTSGMAYWWIASVGEVPSPGASGGTISNLTVWHYRHFGIFGYDAYNLVVDGLRTRTDCTGRVAGIASDNGWLTSDYRQTDVTYTNCDISGATDAFTFPAKSSGTFTVSDSTFASQKGIMIAFVRSVAGGSSIATGRTVVLDNVRSQILPGYTAYPLSKRYQDVADIGDQGLNVMVPDVTTVVDWQQVPGASFGLYYSGHGTSGTDAQGNPYTRSGQDPAFVPAPSATVSVLSPHAGWTNQQLHDNYRPYLEWTGAGLGGSNPLTPLLKPDAPNAATPGACVAGVLLPPGTSNTTYTDIDGFTG
jgi:hypothetical protein